MSWAGLETQEKEEDSVIYVTRQPHSHTLSSALGETLSTLWPATACLALAAAFKTPAETQTHRITTATRVRMKHFTLNQLK